MEKRRLMELAGIQLNEEAKSVQSVLRYFDEGDTEDGRQLYDLKSGFVVLGKEEDVAAIALPLDGTGVKPAIYTPEGEVIPSTLEYIANLDVYKLVKVY